ncbi:MAG: hypothetical protein AAGI72_15535 [Pseudomonadota bacterium]
MKIAGIDASGSAARGAKLELLHPVTKAPFTSPSGEPVTITLLGQDSPQYRSRFQELVNANMESRRRKGAIPHDAVEQSAELLAVCTTDWSGMELEDESMLECNFDNAKQVFESEAWIREQADAFVSDRANFLR